MTERDTKPTDVAPGQQHETLLSEVASYVIGLLLAVTFTATSFWVASTPVLWGPGIGVGLAVLAIAQMGIHLVFFLHLTSGPDNTNNVLALAFGVLVVFLIMAGTLWIMANLNANMVPPAAIANLQMQG
jgi:cytochrome o ubiquinol oxidase operon protein cyoD